MFVITIRRRTIWLCILAVVLTLVAACAAAGLPRLRRVSIGAARGVTVAGTNVGGLLPDEVREVVLGLVASVERRPREALYHSETGEIIPEEAGITLDVDATVRDVMAAPRGSRVSLVTREVPPSVTAAMLKPVYGVQTSEKACALAFNVAWGEEYVPALLSELAKAKVTATFFLTGTWATKFPDLVWEIARLGHEIGNHGYDHPHVERLGEPDIVALIEKNEILIRELTGIRTTLFAPPYGEVNQRIASTAAKLGYTTVMWTVDTIDWERPKPEVILQRVENRIAPGAIILAHPTEPTAAALPNIISRLERKGYRFMTVSDLLKLGEALHSRP
ncbi:MAG: polysaccharide deacetylase family protein [Firmicutes bacterium]|nr:polysaccharide deacetylase family protein [Bacillota bacterium]